MPMELDMVGLSDEQRKTCENTIGPNTFFMLVTDALISGRALSVVRMGDGEKSLYEFSTRSPQATVMTEPYGEAWLQDFGCHGIEAKLLASRLKCAANECTYFAPQIMGIQRPEFGVAKLFRPREKYVDNWFVRTWSRKLQDQLFKQAGHVLFIHGSAEVRQKVGQRIAAAGAHADCYEMNNWRDAETTIRVANDHDAPLVLFSGGPANKFIGPFIAEGGTKPKVVLDLGQAAAVEWT